MLLLRMSGTAFRAHPHPGGPVLTYISVSARTLFEYGCTHRYEGLGLECTFRGDKKPILATTSQLILRK